MHPKLLNVLWLPLAAYSSVMSNLLQWQSSFCCPLTSVVAQHLILLAGEKPDSDRPASVLARQSVHNPVRCLNVRLGHWNPNHVGEDLGELSDTNCSVCGSLGLESGVL